MADIDALEVQTRCIKQISNPLLRRKVNGIQHWKQSIEKYGKHALLIFRSKLLRKMVWCVNNPVAQNWLLMEDYDEVKERVDADYANIVEGYLMTPYDEFYVANDGVAIDAVATEMEYVNPLKKRKIHESSEKTKHEKKDNKKKKDKNKERKKDKDNKRTERDLLFDGVDDYSQQKNLSAGDARHWNRSRAYSYDSQRKSIGNACKDDFFEDSQRNSISGDACKGEKERGPIDDSEDLQRKSIQAKLDAHHKRVLDGSILQAEQMAKEMEHAKHATSVVHNKKVLESCNLAYKELIREVQNTYRSKGASVLNNLPIELSLNFVDSLLQKYDFDSCAKTEPDCTELANLAHTFTDYSYLNHMSALFVKPALLKKWLHLAKAQDYTCMRLVLYGGSLANYLLIEQDPLGFRALKDFHLCLSAATANTFNTDNDNPVYKPGTCIVALLLSHESSDTTIQTKSVELLSPHIPHDMSVKDCIAVEESDAVLVLGRVEPV